MDTQLINLTVPLASAVAVVLISSYANVWLKRLDVKQKEADRSQELHKIYITKRIDSGEVFVEKLAATIDKLDWIRVLLLSANFDGDAEGQHYKQLQQVFQQAQDIANTKIMKVGNAYLYFDEKLLEQETGSVAPTLVLLEKKLVHLHEERFQIGTLLEGAYDSRERENLGKSLRKTRIDFNDTLVEYSSRILEHRAYLVRTCAAVREELAKYGPPA